MNLVIYNENQIFFFYLKMVTIIIIYYNIITIVILLLVEISMSYNIFLQIKILF